MGVCGISRPNWGEVTPAYPNLTGADGINGYVQVTCVASDSRGLVDTIHPARSVLARGHRHGAARPWRNE